MKPALLALGLLVFDPYVLRAQTTWNLVFEDDFDGPGVDPSQWTLYHSAGHDGHGLRRPDAFSVEDGKLVVTARMIDGVLVSGGMAHKQNFRYGKFEFRVRTDPDPTMATNGVILTWPQSEHWPVDGENDMYETGTGATRHPFDTFIHYDAKNRQHNYRHDADGSQWHVMAMEWSPTKLVMVRDGDAVWTLTDQKAIPHVPHHLCIQLDAFKAAMGDPVRMYVDWVKIYQACYEAAGLTATASRDATVRTVERTGLNDGRTSVLTAQATGDFAGYRIPNVEAGLYNVRVGVLKGPAGGECSFSIGVNETLGSAQDLYASKMERIEIDLGNWKANSSGDKTLKVTVIGKGAGGHGFEAAIDYFKLLPQF